MQHLFSIGYSKKGHVKDFIIKNSISKLWANTNNIKQELFDFSIYISTLMDFKGKQSKFVLSLHPFLSEENVDRSNLIHLKILQKTDENSVYDKCVTYKKLVYYQVDEKKNRLSLKANAGDDLIDEIKLFIDNFNKSLDEISNKSWASVNRKKIGAFKAKNPASSWKGKAEKKAAKKAAKKAEKKAAKEAVEKKAVKKAKKNAKNAKRKAGKKLNKSSKKTK